MQNVRKGDWNLSFGYDRDGKYFEFVTKTL